MEDNQVPNTPPETPMVNVKEVESGDIYAIPADKIHELGEGFSEATTHDLAAYDAKKRAEESPVTEGLKSVGQGAASSATFGASDYALKKYGESTGKFSAEDLKAQEEENPVAHTGGEILGLFTPGGLEGTAVKAAGSLAERAAAKVLEKSTVGLAERSLAKKIAIGAAKQAAEGTVMGARQGVQESVIGDPQNVGETIASNALLGGVLGGAFGVGSEVAGAGLNKIYTTAKEVANKTIVNNNLLQKASDSSLFKVFGFTKKDAEMILKEDMSKIEAGASGLGEDVASRADSVAKTMRHNASLVDNGESQLVSTGKMEMTNLTNPEKLLVNTVSETKRIGKELGDLYENSQSPIMGDTVVKSFQDSIDLLKNASDPDKRAAAAKVQELYDNMVQRYGKPDSIEGLLGRQQIGNNIKNLNTTELWQLRQELDDIAAKDFFNPSSPYKEAVKDIRFNVNNNLKSEFAKVNSPEVVAQLERLNKSYRDNLAIINGIRKAAAQESKQGVNLGLKEILAVYGSITHPLGAGAAWLANSTIKKYANPLLAMAGDKRNPIFSGINKVFDEQAGSFIEGTKNFMQNGAQKANLAAKAATINLATGAYDNDKKQAFKDNYTLLDKARNNPINLIDHTSKQLAQMASFAPQIANATSSSLMTGVNFLISKMPQLRPNTVFDKPGHINLPSDLEMNTFNRYVDAVNNPLSVVNDLNKGQLSMEGVEVLKNVYPNIYNNLVQTVMENLPDSKLNYKEKLQLGNLLGVDLTSYNTPMFINEIQQQYVGENQALGQNGNQGQQQAKSMKKVDFKLKDKLTQQQRVLYK